MFADILGTFSHSWIQRKFAMKLGMAVILLPKIADQRTALRFFFVHVSGKPSASKQTIWHVASEQRYYVPIAMIGNLLARWI